MRFPGFEGEWEMKKLGDIGDVKMCRRIFNDETSITGEIPFFKIGSFGKEADAFISKELFLDYKKRFSFPKKGNILISAAGTIGRTVIYNGEDAYFQDSNIVWIENDNTKITNEFLFHVLQIVKYNTEGGTIQRLYNNILKSTKFSSPTIFEQTKIANFSSLINERIATQKKIIKNLETSMKGFREKIFSRKMRFKYENGNDFESWEKKKLGEIGSFQTSSIDKLLKENEKEVYLVNYMNVYRHEKINSNTIKHFQVVTAKNNQILSCNLMKEIFFSLHHLKRLEILDILLLFLKT